MNNINSEEPDIDNEMLPEYDFTGGVRGKQELHYNNHAITNQYLKTTLPR